MPIEPFLASIQTTGFSFNPNGWALCNGQIISISQNTALFALLGTFYGGNGTTNFALPDLRGRFAIGAGQGPGLSPIQLGQIGGEESTQLNLNTMPIHNHSPLIPANTFEGEVSSPTEGSLASRTNGFSPIANGSLGGTSIQPQGNGTPFNLRNPFLGVTFSIALQGIFPSRS